MEAFYHRVVKRSYDKIRIPGFSTRIGVGIVGSAEAEGIILNANNDEIEKSRHNNAKLTETTGTKGWNTVKLQSATWIEQ